MPDNQVPTQASPGQSGRSALLGKLGLGLVLLSGVFFFSMLSVPWWPIATSWKAICAGALFVAVQVAWWAGVALAGPAAIAKLSGWFRRS